MNNVLEKAKALWNKEQIKVLIMLSMTLQIILIFAAPLRKRIRDKRLLILLWLAYLGADYVATLTLGTILANRFHNAGADLREQSLTAFWAPFLLLHLGGPDNITSYSIEDNGLWLRHLLSFVVQVSTALLVLVQSAVQTTRLLVPSVLIFLAGAIKFSERTLALRAATRQRIQKSTLPGNEEILSKIKESELPYGDEMSIIYGYVSFRILKAHIVNYPFDLPSTIKDGKFRGYVNTAFVKEMDKDFKLISVELSYLYDILHTKVPTFIHHISFWVIRTASLLSIVIALVLFHIGEKHDHEVSDLMVTYIFLSVALFLETYSAISLVASKWMVISLMSTDSMWYKKIARFIYRAKNRIFCRGSKERWSGCIGQYCLIQSVMSRRQGSNWLKKTRNFLLRGEDSAEVSEILEKTVIDHIKSLLETVKSYGEYSDLLRKVTSSWISHTLDRYGFAGIKDAMGNKPFGECVIAWHMATDMCYFALNKAPGDSEEGRMREAMCQVSNYMMYLIMERTSMMPPGFAEVTTVRTVEVLKDSNIFGSDSRQKRISLYDATLAANGLYLSSTWDDDTALPLIKSILKHLKQIEEEKSEKQLWEMVRDGWMEMLTYAAVNCSRTEHFKSLSRGGELLTHYWLLLAHYGIMEENNATAGYRFVPPNEIYRV